MMKITNSWFPNAPPEFTDSSIDPSGHRPGLKLCTSLPKISGFLDWAIKLAIIGLNDLWECNEPVIQSQGEHEFLTLRYRQCVQDLPRRGGYWLRER